MADFTFQCICCNTDIDVENSQVGYVVYCPKCMAELIVPDLSAEEPGSVVDSSEYVEGPVSSEEQVYQEDGEASTDTVPQPTGGQHKADPDRLASISQVIYRDENGMPIIPDDVAEAVANNPDALNNLSDTKVALAETLKALQANQQALAEARKQLSERRHASDTDHVRISDTSNQLIHEMPVVDTSHVHEPIPEPPSITDLNPASQGLSDGPNVIVPHDQQVEDFDEPTAEEPYLDEEYPQYAEYIPLYTPHGDFLPFTDEDFAHALEHESDELLDSVSQIRPTQSCWSYSVFALLLEHRINRVMPEVLPVVPLTGVFFGGTQKYVSEMNKQYAVFANILRRMLKPFGEEFQHALSRHDIYAYVEVIDELEQPMTEFVQFMVNFQHIALPKKDPFLRLRALMIQFYDDVRYRLFNIVDRLDERSEMTPEYAKMGTISVSLMPPDVHEFGLLLNHFPKNP